ncbi:MAG: FAD-dependent monooxygenase [Bryobacteraceae bacterium]
MAVTIIGAGPAGASAALGCLAAGGEAVLVDRSRVRKHRVCGEFLSAEIEPLLRRFRLWDEFRSVGPNRTLRLGLHFAGVSRWARLPQPAWGMSRERFDSLLLDAALERGARWGDAGASTPRVLAHGRADSAPRGERLFGFKAHYDARVTDSVELFFFDGCYVGVNTVERDVTNVCGVGPESVLRGIGFNADGLLDRLPALRERLAGARRRWDWLKTGPLVFGHRFSEPVEGGVYRAGDALSFVDPFTGSGLVAAVFTGESAGRAAANGEGVEAHLQRCRMAMGNPFAAASAMRWAWRSGWAGPLLRVTKVPLGWLVGLTRPLVKLNQEA